MMFLGTLFCRDLSEGIRFGTTGKKLLNDHGTLPTQLVFPLPGPVELFNGLEFFFWNNF